MHTSASFLVMLMGVGLFSAPSPPVPSSPPGNAAGGGGAPAVPGGPETGPSLNGDVLPAPRSLPAVLPPQEEPAPAPREQPAAPGGPLPGQVHEEPAPMPQEQTPPPPRLALPGAAQGALPPEVQALQREIQALRMDREAMLNEQSALASTDASRAANGEDNARMRRRLTDLLARAARARTAPPPAPRQQAPAANPPSTVKPKSEPTPGPKDSAASPPPMGKAPPAPSTQPAQPSVPGHKPDNSAKLLTDAPVDPLSLARELFLAGDAAGALKVYRQLEQQEQRAEERLTLQYMMACCLRKLGKMDEAAVLYREAANSGGNDVLVENAQWYLRAMKERRELEGQLDELRQRRQTATPRKP